MNEKSPRKPFIITINKQGVTITVNELGQLLIIAGTAVTVSAITATAVYYIVTDPKVLASILSVVEMFNKGSPTSKTSLDTFFINADNPYLAAAARDLGLESTPHRAFTTLPGQVAMAGAAWKLASLSKVGAMVKPVLVAKAGLAGKGLAMWQVGAVAGGAVVGAGAGLALASGILWYYSGEATPVVKCKLESRVLYQYLSQQLLLESEKVKE